MFENIIGQQKVINLLKNDILNKDITNSILFYGSKSTGKLTVALELTRILNCKYEGDNKCDCDNCKKINDLNFNGLIFLSRRNLSYIIKEYIKCYKVNRKYLKELKYYIKLFSLPLQDFIIKNTLSDGDKKEISDKLNTLSDTLSKNEINEIDIDLIIDAIDKIHLKYKSLNIPIESIRSIIDWTFINQPDIKRVVIIDHFDKLENPSQNILLKRLEEPSKNLYFIIIAENKNRIKNTVLSRCRSYFFNNYKKEEINKITKYCFNKESNHNSLYDFLIRDEITSKDNIIPKLNELLKYFSQQEASFSDLNLFIASLKNKDEIKEILLELSKRIEDVISVRNTKLEYEKEKNILDNLSFVSLNNLKLELEKKIYLLENYSLNPTLLLEGLFYPIKAMVKND